MQVFAGSLGPPSLPPSPPRRICAHIWMVMYMYMYMYMLYMYMYMLYMSQNAWWP